MKLARMGYEKPSPKLTFYKAFFSAQWKFLIHTLVQCVCAKRTVWNEFNCSMASVVICLATDPTPTPYATPLQVQPSTPPSSPPQEQPTMTHESSMSLLNTLMETYATLFNRVAKVESSTNTIMGAQEDASKQGRIDQDVSTAKPTVFDDEEVTMTMAQILIKIKAEKANILDEQIAQRLHDDDIEKVTAKDNQEKNDLERAQVLQKRYDDKEENINWNAIDEQIKEKHLDNIRKYQSLKKKSVSIAQARKNMIIYLKNMAGYKMEHFREKDYPLSNGVMTLMLSEKLQVEEDSEIARDLVMKIFMEANKPKSRSLDTSSK
nr:hypothetical protein [Tanacetum cinerariifolium]